MDNQGRSSTGLPENIAGLLCYALGFISGAVFLAVEKESDFVRFHAIQSLTVFLGLLAVSVAAGFIPLIGWAVALLVAPANLILWLILMYKAFSGERFKLPLAGDIAEAQLAKHFPHPPSSPPVP